MDISGIGKTSLISSIDSTGTSTQSLGAAFAKYLNEALAKVSDIEKESTALTESFAAGETDNIHQVLIAAEKAEIALQFTMQIRSKIMDAYNEIMNMQI